MHGVDSDSAMGGTGMGWTGCEGRVHYAKLLQKTVASQNPDEWMVEGGWTSDGISFGRIRAAAREEDFLHGQRWCREER